MEGVTLGLEAGDREEVGEEVTGGVPLALPLEEAVLEADLAAFTFFPLRWVRLELGLSGGVAEGETLLVPDAEEDPLIEPVAEGSAVLLGVSLANPKKPAIRDPKSLVCWPAALPSSGGAVSPGKGSNAFARAAPLSEP